MLACPECRKLYPSEASECPDDGHALLPAEMLPEPGDGPLEPGAMVGEYRVDRRLGAGTFGAVYAGEQPVIGKRVAIKVLHRKFASDAGVVSRFVAEARAVNRIRHRNIIDIFSFGALEKKGPYFVMELLDGMTLGELLRHETRLGLAEAIPILRGIADGLDAAHEAGITHRDLKPDNIFLAAEKGGGYFPKLLDFGVAKLADDLTAHKTATGAAIGTPSYMAPEQCRARRVDHRADIYALGVVIHEMLTGQRLFQADSAMDVLMMHVGEPPRPMSEVCPDLPRELDAPVLAMLAKRPEHRPSSAGVAVAALAERARVSGVERKAPDESLVPSSFERALARREAATAASFGVRIAAAATPSKEASALLGATETSGPVVLSTSEGTSETTRERQREGEPAAASLVPATTADGRFAISSKGNAIKVWDLRTGQAIHTFQGQPGTLVGATEPAPTAAPGARVPQPIPAEAKRGSRSLSWAMIAVVAAILAAIAFLRSGPTPATSAAGSPGSATAGPAGSSSSP
jgi:serine/threonine-protein kinase